MSLSSQHAYHSNSNDFFFNFLAKMKHKASRQSSANISTTISHEEKNKKRKRNKRINLDHATSSAKLSPQAPLKKHPLYQGIGSQISGLYNIFYTPSFS